jgi:senataxin
LHFFAISTSTITARGPPPLIPPTRQVMIETVDSFQGKQLDVVILSCVRASARSAGVGFVSDVRRTNVAITRAKRALWVLGSAATLRSSSLWRALIE